jgi:hypothetical protein
MSKHSIAKNLIRIIYPFLKIAFKPILKRHLTVFLFHDVTDTPSIFQKKCLNYTTLENFQNCINWISKNYNIIDIKQIEHVNEKNSKPAALITFDDAWAGQLNIINSVNNFEPLTFFTNLGTSKTGIDIAALKNYDPSKVPSFGREVNLRSDEQTKFSAWQGEIIKSEQFEMISNYPNVTLANHGYFHYSSAELTDEEFLRNIEMNESALEKLGWVQKYFAFPFGKPITDFTLSQVRILKQKGYKFVFAADSRLNKLPLKELDYISRVHFSPQDSKDSDFWWATNKSLLPRRF